MSARSPRNRKKAHGLGILAERFAIVLLRLNGYRIWLAVTVFKVARSISWRAAPTRSLSSK